MARIFITGSSDGIGQAAARVLADQGHKVYLHARNTDRAKHAHDAVPNAEGVLIGDLSTIAGTQELAAKANESGPFDVVIHNAGLGPSTGDDKTVDGFQSIFAVNSLAPFILTSLMQKPKRLLYLSSDAHSSALDDFNDITWTKRAWNGWQAYSESKLHNIMLANAVARHWSDVQSCSFHPGWIKTKMVPVDLPGHVSTPGKAIAEFALGRSEIVGDRTGVYFDPSEVLTPLKSAMSVGKQEEFLNICERLSGVTFPK